MDRPATRRDRLRTLLKKAGVPSLLITNFANVTYLTGFTGDDSFLLITATDEILITDPRYTEQVEAECPGLKMAVRRPGVTIIEVVAKTIESTKLATLGIEGDSMTVSQREGIAQKLRKVDLKTTKGMVESLRAIKDREEIAEIREAIRIAEKAYRQLRNSARPDQTEKQFADAMDHEMRSLGAKCASFPSIVAVGPNAALPHARPTDKRIGEAGFFLLDWGASGRLYKSDLTRMVATGKIPPKLERVYRLVFKAQAAAIAAIRPGASCGDVDQRARGIIEEAGFGKNFGHGIGHGIGLAVHESPRMAKGLSEPLAAGMVVTVEPGVYLPGWGGVRIEDDVLVTRTGHEVLTTLPKEWDDVFVNGSP
jgi:Xaa-Pro aminopeptidase